MRDFHQLFDTQSSTFTYVLADALTGEPVIIDPVDKPRLIDIAVPANQRPGLDVPHG